MLKVQLHTHVQGDALDHIPYSPKRLIKRAAKLGYNALAITCHKKVIFNKNIQKIGKKYGVIVIPGIETDINHAHVLIVNAEKSAEQVDSFDKLKKYKKAHPECLIIAPHPFFPSKHTLKKALIENIQIFDAIEHSFCYTKTKNYNKPAIALAKRWKKPLIATSDCHILKHLDLGYTLVNSKPNIPSIIKAIKQNKIKIIHQPISYFKAGRIITRMIFQTFFKKFIKGK